ncbi:MAG: signal peptidase I [Clostridia bacterium]|nr:signal peptidase I [Clostridia bacterium]
MDKTLRNSELYEARYGYKEGRANFIFYAVLLCFALCVCIFRVWWVNNFWGVVVDGESMIYTLEDEQKLLVRRVKDVENLDYGTVIIVDVSDYEECQGIKDGLLIKRLIAKEGDKVRCEDGRLEICFKGTQEFKLIDEPYAHYTNRNAYDFEEYTVGAGEVFFLGDNRNESKDSRYYDYPHGSHLQDRLYKAENVVGYLPNWAYEYREILEKILFAREE